MVVLISASSVIVRSTVAENTEIQKEKINVTQRSGKDKKKKNYNQI